MLDLRASINMMHLTMYQELKIGLLKPSRVVIQLAKKSSVYPEGIVEDVLVKVQDLIFTADVYLLNMGNPKDKKQLMLLGRLFPKTARTLIDCATGKLTCKFAGETVTFDIYKAEQYPPDTGVVDFVDSSEQAVEDVLPEIMGNDQIETIIHGVQLTSTILDKELVEAEQALGAEEDPNASSTSVPLLKGKFPSSLDKPSSLELKRLPAHLKYIYLGEENTLPVIISSELSFEEEVKTMALLRKYKRAIGWTLADLKRINPTVCQHHILLEEDAMPVRDP